MANQNIFEQNIFEIYRKAIVKIADKHNCEYVSVPERSGKYWPDIPCIATLPGNVEGWMVTIFTSYPDSIYPVLYAKFLVAEDALAAQREIWDFIFQL